MGETEIRIESPSVFVEAGLKTSMAVRLSCSSIAWGRGLLLRTGVAVEAMLAP